MTREIIAFDDILIRNKDEKGNSDPIRVEADSFEITIKGPGFDGVPRELDLGEENQKEILTPLGEALQYGRKIKDQPAPMKPKEGEVWYYCPVPTCPKHTLGYSSKNGLKGHIESKHGGIETQPMPKTESGKPVPPVERIRDVLEQATIPMTVVEIAVAIGRLPSSTTDVRNCLHRLGATSRAMEVNRKGRATFVWALDPAVLETRRDDEEPRKPEPEATGLYPCKHCDRDPLKNLTAFLSHMRTKHPEAEIESPQGTLV